MRIVLNLLPLRAGGGRTIGLDLRDAVSSSNSKTAHQYLVLAPDSELAGDRGSGIYPIVCPASKSVIRREVWAARQVRAWGRWDVVVTPFGTPLLLIGGRQIVGFAYSNLLTPEIDFWQGIGKTARYGRRARDRARIAALRRASGWFVETQVLLDRAIGVISDDSERITIIPPSINPVWEESGDSATLPSIPRDGFVVGMLSSYHPNKNLEHIPDIALAIKRMFNGSKIRFALSVDPESAGGKKIRASASRLGVGDRVTLIGPVGRQDVSAFYRSVDALMLLSTLESFSNNIVEAWKYGVPLIIGDHLWSRDICGNAAVYVSLDDPSKIAEVLFRLASDVSYRQDLVAKGWRELEKYPTAAARLERILDFATRIASG